MNRKLLALSGGGCMGQFQVNVLKNLEERAKKLLWEEYDLISGASVGAIHAAAIASGRITMEQMAYLEEEMLKQIFGKKSIIPPLYKREKFIEIWNRIIGNDLLFGDVKTKLMIISVDLVSDRNVFFKSWEDKEKNVPLIDIICRSFAAPLYFGQIVSKIDNRVYSDGGIGTSNFPIDELKLEAEMNGWYSGDNRILIDAIGCLYANEELSFKEIAKSKFIKQVFEFLKPSEGGMARVQSRKDQVRRMELIANKIENISFRYWDHAVDAKYIGMDKIKYLPFYKACGEFASKKPLIEIMKG